MLKYSDFIGKRLDDAIKYMPDDTILHIGSRTGFLFVGDKNRYYFDIKKVNSDMIKTQEAIAETAKRKLYCEIRKLIVPGIKNTDAKNVLVKYVCITRRKLIPGSMFRVLYHWKKEKLLKFIRG